MIGEEVRKLKRGVKALFEDIYEQLDDNRKNEIDGIAQTELPLLRDILKKNPNPKATSRKQLDVTMKAFAELQSEAQREVVEILESESKEVEKGD